MAPSLPRRARASKLPTVKPDPNLDVTLVLPVFNETGHLSTELQRIVNALDTSQYSYDIVMVDDG